MAHQLVRVVVGGGQPRRRLRVLPHGVHVDELEVFLISAEAFHELGNQRWPARREQWRGKERARQPAVVVWHHFRNQVIRAACTSEGEIKAAV